MTPRKQLTIAEAAARTRQPAELIEKALAHGDLRSLTPRDVDAWRRGVIAQTAKRDRNHQADDS